MVKEKLGIEQLESGKTYMIILNDCCIQGEIPRATFKYHPVDEEGTDTNTGVFDIGTITSLGSSQMWFVEAE